MNEVNLLSCGMIYFPRPFLSLMFVLLQQVAPVNYFSWGWRWALGHDEGI